MHVASWVAAYGLALVFGVAGTAKWRDPEGTQEAIRGFGLPSAIASWGARILPAAEVAIALLLLLPATSLVGAAAGIFLLVIFVAMIVWNMANGRRPECRCFGQIHSKPAGLQTIFRNLGLIGMATLVLGNGGTSTTGITDSEILDSPGEVSLLISGIALVVSLAALKFAWDARQYARRARSTTADRGHTHAGVGLSQGDVAPPFELEDPDGSVVTAGHLLTDGNPALLVFSASGCGSCKDFLPELARWEKQYSQLATVALISTGDEKENVDSARHHDLTTLLFDKGGLVSHAYGAELTPSAIVVSPRGIVEYPLVAGPDAIRATMSSLVADRSRNLWWRATGTHLEFDHGNPEQEVG